MKTNRMIIVVDQMIEYEDILKKSKTSWHGLFRAHQESEAYTLSWEDIFIGSTACWKAIKERISEYAHLSHLRNGRLEILYYSQFDKEISLFNSSYQDYFQFCDESISVKEIEKLKADFNHGFDLEIKRLSDKKMIYENDKIEESVNAIPLFSLLTSQSA